MQWTGLPTKDKGTKTGSSILEQKGKVCNVVTYLEVVLFVYFGPRDAREHNSFYMHRCKK